MDLVGSVGFRVVGLGVYGVGVDLVGSVVFKVVDSVVFKVVVDDSG